MDISNSLRKLNEDKLSYKYNELENENASNFVKALYSPRKKLRESTLQMQNFSLFGDSEKMNEKKVKSHFRKTSMPEDINTGGSKKLDIRIPIKPERKESGERRKKKDGVNRKFMRKNAKKSILPKKKKEANANNKIKVKGTVSAKLNALIQRLGQNTSTKPTEKTTNIYGDKVVMAPRIKAALEKFNKKKEERPQIIHYGGKNKKSNQATEEKSIKDNMSTGGNVYEEEEEEEEYEYEEYEDYEEGAVEEEEELDKYIKKRRFSRRSTRKKKSKKNLQDQSIDEKKSNDNTLDNIKKENSEYFNDMDSERVNHFDESENKDMSRKLDFSEDKSDDYETEKRIGENDEPKRPNMRHKSGRGKSIVKRKGKEKLRVNFLDANDNKNNNSLNNQNPINENQTINSNKLKN